MSGYSLKNKHFYNARYLPRGTEENIKKETTESSTVGTLKKTLSVLCTLRHFYLEKGKRNSL
jgi:hypothetical protein